MRPLLLQQVYAGNSSSGCKFRRRPDRGLAWRCRVLAASTICRCATTSMTILC